MNKARQIYDIIFPMGIFYTYIPALGVIALNVWGALTSIKNGMPDWFTFCSCLAVAVGIAIGLKTRTNRRMFADHKKFMADVIATVRPRLDELHQSAFTEKGIDFEKLSAVAEEGMAIIAEEVQRRRSLENVSKTDKP